MNRSSSEGPPRKRFSWRTLFRPAAAAAVTGGLLLGFLAIPAATASAAQPHVSTGSQIGTYVPVTPTRITDTRAGSGFPNAGDTIGPNQSLKVQVGNLGGVVPANATVAVLNVTAINPTQAGFVSVNPAGNSGPVTVSNLDFVAGQTVANLVTVPLNGGAVDIYNFTGNTNVAVDVFGYYSATPAADGSGLFNAIVPFRALGSGPSGAPIGPNSSVPVQVTGGQTGVPTGATAVVVNLTAAGGTLPSFLTSYADGTTRPNVSNLNFVPNQSVANRATVPVGSDGMIQVYNLQGNVNVDVDISGYYTSAGGGNGSAFVPITPQRLTDTRTGTNGSPIASNTTETFNLTNTSIPATATSVATNVTAIPGNAPGFLTVFPVSSSTPPLASDIDWAPNQVVPNFTIADTQGTGQVNIYNFIGATTNVAIDAFGYFTPPTAPVTVTATPDSIGSGTGHSSIMATVAQPNGTPVAGDQVVLSTSGAAGVCGSLSATSGTTNANGQVTVTYNAGANNGVCTINAVEANNGDTGSTTVTQGNAITLSASPNPVVANGVSTSTLTAAVTSNGAPVAGDVVHFSTGVANPAGACGTIQGGGAATTNAGGIAQINYIPSTTPGFCPVGAVETATGQTSNIVTINQTSGAAINTVTTVANPTTVVANGTSTSSISATVKTSASAPVAGDTVSFAVTAGDGTVSPQFATTNASGVATTTYTSSTTPGSDTVTATEANTAQTGSATVTQTAPPNVVTLSASPASLPGNGAATSTLTVTSTNGNGSPGAGQGVILIGTGTCGLISGPAGTTNPAGVYTTTYQAAASSGFCTINAFAGGTPSNPTIIDQTSNPAPNPPNTVTAAANPTSITANGTATSTITATVLANNGTPVNGDPVIFSTAGADCTPLSGSGTVTATTGANGKATATYTATSTPGICTINVAEANSGAQGATTVNQTQPLNSVALTPSSGTVLAANTSSVAFSAAVTAGSPGSANNDTVTYTLSGSPSGACGTINPASGSTGATNTPVTALYQASTTPGFCTVTATESATGATSSSLIDQTANPTPIGVSVAVTASPSSIPANGTSTSTISATVTTTNPAPGTPVAGDTVMFTVAGAHAGTLDHVFAVTNASGVATATYTSSTTAGTPAATITATEANAGQSGTATVNQSVAANVIAFTATPQAVHPSANSVLQVTDTNAGTPVNGALITIVPIAGTCGTYTPIGGFTLANGTFTSTYTAPAATNPPAGTFCTLQAGDGSGATATVTINNLAT